MIKPFVPALILLLSWFQFVKANSCEVLFIGASGNSFPNLWEQRGYSVDRSSNFSPLNSSLSNYDVVWINLQGSFFDLTSAQAANLKAHLDNDKGIYFVGEPGLAGNLPLSYINSWVAPSAVGTGLSLAGTQIGSGPFPINMNPTAIDSVTTSPFNLTTIAMSGYGWLNNVQNNNNKIALRNNDQNQPVGVAFNAANMVDGNGRIGMMVDSNVFNDINASAALTSNAELNINMLEFLSNDISDDCKSTVDVSVNKVLTTPPPYNVGDTIDYSITVSNNSINDATNVVVSDTMSNLTLSSITGGSCSPASFPCTIPSLTAGDSETLIVSTTIVNAGVFDNSVVVSTVEPDLDLANNTDNSGNSGETERIISPVAVSSLNYVFILIMLLVLFAACYIKIGVKKYR